MDWALRRNRMVERYVRSRGVEEERLLHALADVPRHEFVEEALQDRAYGEDPLPIGAGQTISRPYVVARMTELLQVRRDHRVLEIGTGSGYQAAVLARLAREVYSVERIGELSERASAIFGKLDITNVHLRISDGSVGWPEKGPFPRILVTAGSSRIPGELIDQLEPEGGRMIAPVGPRDRQVLVLVRTDRGRAIEEEIEPCGFVPLIHGA